MQVRKFPKTLVFKSLLLFSKTRHGSLALTSLLETRLLEGGGGGKNLFSVLLCSFEERERSLQKLFWLGNKFIYDGAKGWLPFHRYTT